MGGDEMVAGLRAGDAATAEAFYERHVGLVRFVVADNVADPFEREDVVQEVFARAYTRIHQLEDPARVRAWLLQIARRAAIDARRARCRRPEFTELEDRTVIDLDPAPDVVAEVRVLSEAVAAGLAGLSARDRQVLTMVVELGFGLDDVAAALDISYTNAKVVLHRARRRLRDAVEPALAV